MNTKKGALPYQAIKELIIGGFITGALQKNLAPASLDLSVSNKIYRIGGITLPKHGEKIRELLERMDAEPHNISLPLESGALYLILLNEAVSLPRTVYGYCNPKSTTGRLDIHIRVLADGVPRFDALTPSGYKGKLWALVAPRSFPIKLHKGYALAQLRLFTYDTRLNETELEVALKTYKLLFDKNGKNIDYEKNTAQDRDGSIILTLDISEGLIGYESIKIPSFVLDVAKLNHYQPDDFFKPIYAKNAQLCLQKSNFYVLSTSEYVRVPPHLACEMRPMDNRSGEFRAHYAGFIDPGWGWGSKGEKKGRPLTLEVRPYEDSIVIRENQPIAKIRFERMVEIPEKIYDLARSNYTKQKGPQLAKQFKQM